MKYKDPYIYIYTYIHTYVYIYIYTHISMCIPIGSTTWMDIVLDMDAHESHQLEFFGGPAFWYVFQLFVA